MLERTSMRLIRKLAILSLLAACFYVFGYSDHTQSVAAAPCIQECETNRNYCNDTCDDACRADSSDAACYSCLQSCSQTYFQCLSYAVSCQDLDVQPGRCEVGWGMHCPVINGIANCSDPSAHGGYYLICELFTQTGIQSVSCPDHDYCTGSGGLPPWIGL